MTHKNETIIIKKVIHMHMFRGFISVDIQPTNEIRKFVKSLKDTDVDMKLVSLDSIHLTLKFLGNTDERIVPQIVDILKKSVEFTEPFVVTLGSVGAFPSLTRINVVWIGISNPDNLIKIAEYLDENLVDLGFNKDKRKFSPHVTIARIKSHRNIDKIRTLLKDNSTKKFGEFIVNQIKLKKSVLTPKGPIYSTISDVQFSHFH